VLRIGLTGGIGSGKSTVAALLAERGALVIDADRIAREVVEPGTPGLAAVVAEFGEQVLALVFSDPTARARLDAVVHPLIRERAAEALSAAPPGAVVVQDIPLLVETGQAGSYDLVLVVATDVEERVRRLVGRGLTAEDARARIASQASDEERAAVADVVIDNDAGRAELAAAVDRFWAERVVPARA
jgi:dephospho-CoA kinase